MSVGTFAKAGAIEIDTQRIDNIEKKSIKETMLARKSLGHVKRTCKKDMWTEKIHTKTLKKLIFESFTKR